MTSREDLTYYVLADRTIGSDSPLLEMRNCSPDLPRKEPRSERIMRDMLWPQG